MIEIDARGLSCPLPVIKTRQAMDENPGAEINILANADVARENVLRLAATRKYSAKTELTAEGDFRILLNPATK